MSNSLKLYYKSNLSKQLENATSSDLKSELDELNIPTAGSNYIINRWKAIQRNDTKFYRIISDSCIEDTTPSEKNETFKVTNSTLSISGFNEHNYLQEEILREVKESRLDHSELKNQIRELEEKLATKEEIISLHREQISTIKEESQKIQLQASENIVNLQSNLNRYLPHRRTFFLSLYFSAFFGFSFLCSSILNVEIVTPFWTFFGLAVSFCFIILSYSLYFDWNKKKNDRYSHN